MVSGQWSVVSGQSAPPNPPAVRGETGEARGEATKGTSGVQLSDSQFKGTKGDSQFKGERYV